MATGWRERYAVKEIRVSDDLHSKLKAVAALERKSVGRLLEDLLRPIVDARLAKEGAL